MIKAILYAWLIFFQYLCKITFFTCYIWINLHLTINIMYSKTVKTIEEVVTVKHCKHSLEHLSATGMRLSKRCYCKAIIIELYVTQNCLIFAHITDRNCQTDIFSFVNLADYWFRWLFIDFFRRNSFKATFVSHANVILSFLFLVFI